MNQFFPGLSFLTAVISLTVPTVPLVDVAAKMPISQGFKQIISDTGVQVYQKKYANGQFAYVTIVNLSVSSIRNLTGAVNQAPNGTIAKKLLGEFWLDALIQNTSTQKAKVIVNGAFFSTNDEPTKIAFGLKLGGNTVSYGYAIGKEYPGEIRTFSFNSSPGIANIQPYSQKTFDSATPEVVGALDAKANKSASSYLPRTFVGVRDDDGNGSLETVILYSSTYARQIDAENTLKNFGASVTAMLDGGGSTGLIVDGKAYIPNNRKIPHAIAFFEGK